MPACALRVYTTKAGRQNNSKKSVQDQKYSNKEKRKTKA